jgi:hypothetical protein
MWNPRPHGSASWGGASPRRGVLLLAAVAVGTQGGRGGAGTARQAWSGALRKRGAGHQGRGYGEIVARVGVGQRASRAGAWCSSASTLDS